MDAIATSKFSPRYRLFLRLYHAALSIIVGNIAVTVNEENRIRFEGSFIIDPVISETYRKILQRALSRFIALHKAFVGLGDEKTHMATKRQHMQYIATVGACGFYAVLITHPDRIMDICKKGHVGLTLQCPPWLARIIKNVNLIGLDDFQLNFYNYNDIVKSPSENSYRLHLIPHQQLAVARLVAGPKIADVCEETSLPNTPSVVQITENLDFDVGANEVVDVESYESENGENDDVSGNEHGPESEPEPVPSTSRGVRMPTPPNVPVDLSIPKRVKK